MQMKVSGSCSHGTLLCVSFQYKYPSPSAHPAQPPPGSRSPEYTSSSEVPVYQKSAIPSLPAAQRSPTGPGDMKGDPKSAKEKLSGANKAIASNNVVVYLILFLDNASKSLQLRHCAHCALLQVDDCNVRALVSMYGADRECLSCI